MTSSWCLCVFVRACVCCDVKTMGRQHGWQQWRKLWRQSRALCLSSFFYNYKNKKIKKMSSVPFLLQITATSRTPGADISWYVTVYVSEPQTLAQKAKQTSRSLSQDLVISHNDNHNILQRRALNWPFKYITKRRNPPRVTVGNIRENKSLNMRKYQCQFGCSLMFWQRITKSSHRVSLQHQTLNHALHPQTSYYLRFFNQH